MEEKTIPMSEVDRLYGDDYRNENSQALSSDHVLPSNTADGNSGESLTPKADNEAAKELAQQLVVKPEDKDKH
jgi:hypothetical protein